MASTDRPKALDEQPRDILSSATTSEREAYFLEVDEDAELIGDTIRAAGGRSVQGIELALEAIRSKIPKVRTELGASQEPLENSDGWQNHGELVWGRLRWTWCLCQGLQRV